MIIPSHSVNTCELFLCRSADKAVDSTVLVPKTIAFALAFFNFFFFF